MEKRKSKTKFKVNLEENEYFQLQRGVVDLKNLNDFIIVRVFDRASNTILASYPMQVDELKLDIKQSTTDPSHYKIGDDEYIGKEIQVFGTYIDGTRLNEKFNNDLVEFYKFAFWEVQQIEERKREKGL